MKPAACFVSSSCSRFRWLLVPSTLGQGTWSAGAESPARQTVSLTHHMQALILSADFLLHMPCWFHFYPGIFSYTSRAGFIFMRGVSSTHPTPTFFYVGSLALLPIPCCLHFYAGSFSYTSRATLTFWKEYLLHIPCWLFFLFFLFYLGSFSYTSCAVLIFMQEVSLTYPVLFSFRFFNQASSSYTSHAGVNLTAGVSLRHTALA